MLRKVWRKIKKWYWKGLLEQELRSYYDMRDMCISERYRDLWDNKISKVKKKIRNLG